VTGFSARIAALALPIGLIPSLNRADDVVKVALCPRSCLFARYPRL